jgi:hypothetical protein
MVEPTTLGTGTPAIPPLVSLTQSKINPALWRPLPPGHGAGVVRLRARPTVIGYLNAGSAGLLVPMVETALHHDRSRSTKPWIEDRLCRVLHVVAGAAEIGAFEEAGRPVVRLEHQLLRLAR